MAGKLAVGPELAIAVASELADQMGIITNCWPQDEPAVQIEFDEADDQLAKAFERVEKLLDLLAEWARMNGVTRRGAPAIEVFDSITK